MDPKDFMNDAEAMLNKFKSRTPRNTTSTIDSATAGGEFSIAIKELVFSLAKNGIAVTATERDTLMRLTEHLRESHLTEMVLALDFGSDEL